MNRVRTYHRGYAAATLLYFGFLATIVWLANAGIARDYFDQAEVVFRGDKIAHAFLMGPFAFLLNSALHCRKIGNHRWSMMTGSAIVYLLVLGEEFSQRWVPSRSFDFMDALFDVIGIYVFSMLAEKNNNKKKEWPTYKS